MAAKPGLFRIIRSAYRTSWTIRSSHIQPHISRISSLKYVMLPNCRCAACVAAARDRPRSPCSSRARSKWISSSRARSSSCSRLARHGSSQRGILTFTCHSPKRHRAEPWRYSNGEYSRKRCVDPTVREGAWRLRRATLVSVMETTDFGNRDDPSVACRLDWSAARRVFVQCEMRPTSVVEVDNPTPIVLSYENSVIRGIHGSVVPSRSTRCSSSRGTLSVGAASRRSGIVYR